MSEKKRKKDAQHGGSDSSLPKKQNKLTVDLTRRLRTTLDWLKRVTGIKNPPEDDFHVSSVHTSLHSLSSLEDGTDHDTTAERKPLLHNNVDNPTISLLLDEEEDPYDYFPKEQWKTIIVGLILFLVMYLNTVSLVLTHQRRPEFAPPLPDIILDTIPTVDNALYAAEIIIAISFTCTMFLIIFHRFRWIVIRRCFFLVGVLYFIRAFTMYLTVLPTASYTYYCSPKLNSTSVLVVMREAMGVLAGFGLSINGRHIYCGDYMYSGHTITLVLTFLFVQEYAPRSSWKWLIIHWIVWCMSVAGIVLILISRGHYSIDIVVAYYFTTRMFWIYHAMASMEELKVLAENNFLSRVCWFRIFHWMEGNVQGILPKQYSLPFSSDFVEL